MAIDVVKWWKCNDCDVRWRGTESECWCCGKSVKLDPIYARPLITSQHGGMVM